MCICMRMCTCMCMCMCMCMSMCMCMCMCMCIHIHIHIRMPCMLHIRYSTCPACPAPRMRFEPPLISRTSFEPPAQAVAAARQLGRAAGAVTLQLPVRGQRPLCGVSSRTTYHLPPTTYHLPPTTYHLPPTTYHPPPTTYHLLGVCPHARTRLSRDAAAGADATTRPLTAARLATPCAATRLQLLGTRAARAGGRRRSGRRSRRRGWRRGWRRSGRGGR